MSKEAPLKDHTFVFTGGMLMPRDVARNNVLLLGGRVTTGLSGKTTHLVAGTEPGQAKLSKAKELGVTVLSEDQFVGMIDKARPALDKVINTSINNASAGSLDAEKGAFCTGPPEAASEESFTDSEEYKQALEGATPDAATSADTEPWAKKYSPHVKDDILGNPGAITQLEGYITGRTDYKAALISGPPGVGKTTTAHLLSKLNKLEVVEFNASDVRSKNSLIANISGIVNNLSIGQDFKIKDRILIMDEVDGMTSDRGGIPELVKIIKGSKMPIICICNDRTHPKMRTLANHCLDIRFRKLDARSILPRIKSILNAEGKQLTDGILNEIILSCGSDMRYILNTVQRVVSKSEVTASAISDTLIAKIPARSVFELASELFQRRSAADKIDRYFEDYSILPLFVHENFPKCKMDLAKLHKITESVSFSDLQDAKIHGPSQEWSLMPYHGFFSCACPTQGLMLASRVDFPAYLGQMSKMRKNARIFSTFSRHCSYVISTTDLVHYSSPIFNRAFISGMQSGDIKAVTDLMLETELLREDFIMLNELLDNTYKAVSTKNKTALTREYKKLKRVLPYQTEDDVKEESSSEE